MKQGLKNTFIIFLISFILASCIDIKHKISINRDGSGNTTLEIVFSKGLLFDPTAVFKIKENLRKEGWKIVKEEERNDNYIIVAGKRFKDVSELNDENTRYSFFSEKKGILTESYSFEIEFIESLDFPIFYELFVEMPGEIDETNGTKVSSYEVKWSLKGFISEGTILFVKSSGFVISPFVLVIIFVSIIVFFIGVIILRKRL